MVTTEAGNYKFICFTDVGKELMLRLRRELLTRTASRNTESDDINSEIRIEKDMDTWTGKHFRKGNILVYIGAVGIAVRAIAKYVQDKETDPGVVAIDEQGLYAIPVLSGHIGGAVDAAKEISEIIGAVPVITTATDLRGAFAVDVFAVKNNLIISDIKLAKSFTARLLKNEKKKALITPKKHSGILCLIPKCIVIGIGCKKGKAFEELRDFIGDVLDEEELDIRAVKAITSVDIKKDEEGIIAVSKELNAAFYTYSSETLMEQEGDFSASEFVKSITGVDNVCERSLSAYGCREIIRKKCARDGMTLAIGITDFDVPKGYEEYLDIEMNSYGVLKKLSVVGIGPGSYEAMTIKAKKTLSECDCIVGYTVYCDLVRPYFPEKEFISTPMTTEEKRVRMAFEKAAEGKKVALICSGDAGVYGMAGLSAKLTGEFGEVNFEVIPGVTAALSGAALLGAPLIHDFCLISLSDRLTPMELIEKRLRAAAGADLGIVLYNPESKGRRGYLSHACDILMEITGPDRICGIVKNIGREGEYSAVMTLGELKNADADMFSTVFIGNSTTESFGNMMVTSRGYKSEG